MLRSIENQTLDPSFCLQQQTEREDALGRGPKDSHPIPTFTITMPYISTYSDLIMSVWLPSLTITNMFVL